MARQKMLSQESRTEKGLEKFFDPILKGAVRLNDYKRTSTHEP